MQDSDYTRFTEGLFDEDLQDQQIDFESEIDELYNNVGEYRKSAKFRKILDFCSKFRSVAPFNAMLIELQRPGCELILTGRQWLLRFNRMIRPNAQPLLYLNRTPVGAMYDISDTVSMDNNGMTDQEIIDEVAHPFKRDGDFDERILKTMIENLQYFGIAYDLNFNASGRFGAYISKQPVSTVVCFRHRGQSATFKWTMPYFVSINKEAHPLQAMQSLCHELGHFFCHHLPPETSDWWVMRRHDKIIREFEAETTAYMVCKRNGIPCPNSEAYLAHYAEENKEIPHNISVETVMKAVSAIEKMFVPMSWSDGYLYKRDAAFKERLKRERSGLSR